MPTIPLPRHGTARAWRDAARRLAAVGIPPEDILWQHGDHAPDLFADAPAAPPPDAAPLTVPRAFVTLADTVCWHADPQRFARLYTLLWRLRATPGLIADGGDPEVTTLRRMEKAVRRDMHKMKAFVRFREIGDPDGPRRRFAAWFEPTHHATEPVAPFFARRFGDMDWIIATPHCTARFEDGTLRITDGQPRPNLSDDATEALWTTYFRSIFNPARLKIRAMTSEMPKKYWKNLPEAAAIPDLVAGAPARAREMQAAAPTAPPARAARLQTTRQPDPPAPDRPDTLAGLSHALDACTRCPLHASATRAVPGEGPADAPLMIVGEQPGDREDLDGRPFTGPAGRLFDRIAGAAGLDRSTAYVTNAVKHFKFQARGKRRIHQRPDAGEVQACRWWLEHERALLRPKLIVAMGATAAAALTGTGRDITARRGTLEQTADGTPVLLTVHPSYLLRCPEDQRPTEEARFRADLETARAQLAHLGA
ncbi:UdgX family uracil-DNA binding protein [Tranquillimonas rosea]|uniref:UdgX family uracil-DNA binding protein n=1 Tax=Tranquillimonas rosea TaxID=641238 RepID=UPI003BAA46C2